MFQKIDVGTLMMSSFSNNEHYPKYGRPTHALEKNDTIVCVNGKSVNGMTEYQFVRELDHSGQELILAVRKTSLSG